jgi:hypothetical protein
MALSTDIADSRISGVSLIGKTVFTYDDGRWYIVEEDLSLSPYFLNSSIDQAISVDHGNSSTNNLSISGSFVGNSLSTLKVAGIQVSLKADQNCLVQVQQSQDNINWDIIDEYYYNKIANNFGVTVQAVSSHVRVVIVNLSTIEPTTYFRLQTVLCPSVEAVPRSLDPYGNFKTSINGMKDKFGFDGQFSPVRDLRITEPYKMVGTTLGASIDPNFITASFNGAEASSGVANSVATVVSGTSNNGYGQLQSVLKARYVFGHPHLWRGITRLPTVAVSGNTRRFGMFTTSGSTTNPEDGAFFEFSANGTMSLCTVSGGTKIVNVSSGSFNGAISEYILDTNSHALEIVAYTHGVWFFIDNVLVHNAEPTNQIFYKTLTTPITAQSINSASGSSTGTLEIWNASISRLGRSVTAPTSKYFSGTTSASGILMKAGSGALHNVIISNVANTSKVVIYDSSSGSSTDGIVFSTGNMSNHLVPFSIPFGGMPFFNGLTISIRDAACNVTVVYE